MASCQGKVITFGLPGVSFDTSLKPNLKVCLLKTGENVSVPVYLQLNKWIEIHNTGHIPTIIFMTQP